MRNRCNLLVILLLITVPATAQKKKRSNNDMPYVEDARPDERTAYFIGKLSTNDTIKLKSFLEAGINLNGLAEDAGAESRYNKSILSYAIDWCDANTIEFLLKHGADPNLRIRDKHKQMFTEQVSYEFSMYPLEAAAEANSIEKMELLVKYGADINRCTEGLKEIAARKNNLALMDFIEAKTGTTSVQSNSLAVMTEPEILNDFSKITPDLINKLAAKGVDINAHSTKGGTALINVIQNSGIKNKVELINALIKNGANVNKPNKENPNDMKAGLWKFYPTSPLKAAIEQRNIEIVKLLVENGANVNQTDGGNSPLKTAKTDAIKEYLILKGAK